MNRGPIIKPSVKQRASVKGVQGLHKAVSVAAFKRTADDFDDPRATSKRVATGPRATRTTRDATPSPESQEMSDFVPPPAAASHAYANRLVQELRVWNEKMSGLTVLWLALKHSTTNFASLPPPVDFFPCRKTIDSTTPQTTNIGCSGRESSVSFVDAAGGCAAILHAPLLTQPDRHHQTTAHYLRLPRPSVHSAWRGISRLFAAAARFGLLLLLPAALPRTMAEQRPAAEKLPQRLQRLLARAHRRLGVQRCGDR
jgi:hypothetical protein